MGIIAHTLFFALTFSQALGGPCGGQKPLQSWPSSWPAWPSTVTSAATSVSASTVSASQATSKTSTSKTTAVTTSSWAQKSSSVATATSSTAAAASASASASGSGDVWQPAPGTTWNYQLSVEATTSTQIGDIDVWDIDLFANSAQVISSLQAQGAKVICYFSAGSWEDWRPDASSFATADLGNGLDGWPGEKWLNIRSTSVRQLMLKRMDMAVQKGCDGVDPDNVDGYDNNNGLKLTQADSIDYMRFLADAAQDRGLSIGLKNAGQIIPHVIDVMQWSVNEQCAQYDECSVFAPFIKAGKPVFHVEYPKGDSTNNKVAVSATKVQSACQASDENNFSTIIKNMNLDTWIQEC